MVECLYVCEIMLMMCCDVMSQSNANGVQNPNLEKKKKEKELSLKT